MLRRQGKQDRPCQLWQRAVQCHHSCGMALASMWCSKCRLALPMSPALKSNGDPPARAVANLGRGEAGEGEGGECSVCRGGAIGHVPSNNDELGMCGFCTVPHMSVKTPQSLPLSWQGTDAGL